MAVTIPGSVAGFQPMDSSAEGPYTPSGIILQTPREPGGETDARDRETSSGRPASGEGRVRGAGRAGQSDPRKGRRHLSLPLRSLREQALLRREPQEGQLQVLAIEEAAPPSAPCEPPDVAELGCRRPRRATRRDRAGQGGARTEIGQPRFSPPPPGLTMCSGRTRRSNSSAVTWPRARAASRRVVPASCARFAIAAARS